VIDQLPLLTPDPDRAARVAAKCRARMTPRNRRKMFEPALLAAFCVIDLTAVALVALQVFALR
jgi:hypothetical protein